MSLTIGSSQGGFGQFGGDGGFNIFGGNAGFSSNTDSEVSYDPDAQLLFSFMDPEPPDAVKELYNDFIIGCKADVSLTGNTSNWDELKALWILCAITRQQAYLNVRYPSLTPISDVVQPDFFSGQYLQGNGSTMYVNLNWNPTTAAQSFSQDSSCIGVYIETEASGALLSMGASNASNQGCFINCRTATSIMQGTTTGANANIGPAGTSPTAIGFRAIRRDNATQVKTNKGEETDSFTNTSASVALVNLSMFLCARNANGSPGGFDSKGISFAFTASGNIDNYKLSLRMEAFRS